VVGGVVFVLTREGQGRERNTPTHMGTTGCDVRSLQQGRMSGAKDTLDVVQSLRIDDLYTLHDLHSRLGASTNRRAVLDAALVVGAASLAASRSGWIDGDNVSGDIQVSWIAEEVRQSAREAMGEIRSVSIEPITGTTEQI